MVATGETLDWGEERAVDKHCIGGLPGNRTPMLVVPIVAAHALLIPKTSSRAITSPTGPADTMEVLAKINLDPDTLRRIVRHQRGCLAWGGTARLAPVDDVLISVERPLRVDSRGQLVASILAKKLAAGSTHLLIDIPVGPTAKVRSTGHGLSLRKLFEYVGDRLGIHLEVVFTDGSHPVGRGIGPVLEARDIMRVLANDPDAPMDLRQRALRLAGRIIEFDPDVRGGSGYAIARDILDSGRALARMHAIIDAQGRRRERSRPVSPCTASTPSVPPISTSPAGSPSRRPGMSSARRTKSADWSSGTEPHHPPARSSLRASMASPLADRYPSAPCGSAVYFDRPPR